MRTQFPLSRHWTVVVERAFIPVVVAQHVEDLAILSNTRWTLAFAGHVALRHLAHFDERIAAHQDNCVVAGEYGTQKLKEQLAEAEAAQLFAAAVVALNIEDRAAFEQCVTVVEEVPDNLPGAAFAVAWITSAPLKGVAKDLLEASSPIRRQLGLPAGRMHGTDPGPASLAGLQVSGAGARAESLRTAGALGKQELLDVVRQALRHEEISVRAIAARSAMLLGSVKGARFELFSKRQIPRILGRAPRLAREHPMAFGKSARPF